MGIGYHLQVVDIKMHSSLYDEIGIRTWTPPLLAALDWHPIHAWPQGHGVLPRSAYC